MNSLASSNSATSTNSERLTRRGFGGVPRYPNVQDPNEAGLSLLRVQYEVAGNPHLAWRIENGTVEIIGSDVRLKLTGEGERVNQIATLICRAVKLGWEMLNELEPEQPTCDAAGCSLGDPVQHVKYEWHIGTVISIENQSRVRVQWDDESSGSYLLSDLKPLLVGCSNVEDSQEPTEAKPS